MVLENRYIKLFLYATLFISFVVSINVGARRFQFEAANNKVEVAVSYNDIEKLSVWGGGITPKALLTRLKEESGITSVAVEEDTLEYFADQGKVTVLKGSEVMNMYRVGHVNRYLLTHLYREIKVKPDRFYLIVDEKEDFEQIRDFLRVEFGKELVRQIGRNNILEVVDDRDDLMQIGLGVSQKKLKLLEQLDLRPIIRLRNSNRLSKDVIKQKVLSFVSTVPQATIVFEGKTILGYPSQIDYVSEKVIDNELKVGIVEFSRQLGEKSLAKELPEHVLRVHSISGQELTYMPKKKAVARYLRAAKERGMKILFVHPYYRVFQEQNIVDYNVSFLRQITDGLEDFGFSVEPVLEMPVNGYQPAKKWELFLLSIGVLTTILFLIHYYMPLTIKRMLTVYVLFGGTFYVFYLLQALTFWNQFMATLIAILFPTLAVISQFPSEKVMASYQNRVLPAMIYFLKLLGICLLGAFLIVGFLSDIKFVFGIERFFGVKLSFILPLIFIGLYFFLRPHRISSMFYILRRLYFSPVRTVALVSILLCLASILILVLRSGNYIVFPSLFFEEKFRSFLEAVLFVRPRTKEFVIGYPFLLFAFMMVDRTLSRQWLWFFNVLGAVALISVVNSFCHVHTPLNISLYRTILGMVLGFGLGFVYLSIFKGLESIYKKLT
jgi:hypothetical protein